MRTLKALVIAAALVVPIVAAPPGPTREDAERLRVKISAIVSNGSSARPVPRRTAVLEREVNAYIVHNLREEIPLGVIEPAVTIVGDGRLAGRAVVDLDAVRKSRKRGVFDPLGYLSGRLPVSAIGTLTTDAGVARLTIQAADISGVPVPKVVLQELVSYYSRSSERPDGINLDDPFSLPAGIRQIEVGKGQAIVVQ